MPQYRYKAIDEAGRVVRGDMQASSLDDLETRIAGMSLDLISAREKGKGMDLRLELTVKSTSGKVDRKDLIVFCFYMEQLISAGVPLVDGIMDLRDTLGESSMRDIMASLVEDMQGGQRLSEAMSRFPKVFDAVFINLIQVGEVTGSLDTVFKHLMDGMKWQDELISQTKKLMIYPTILALVITAVVFFLMIYLVPQLVSFIQSMGRDIPFHTKMLIGTSDFFVDYWYVVLATPVLIFIVIMVGKRLSSRVQYLVDAMKLRIWVVGPILEKVILARFASFFALMYVSGITVLESLTLTSKLADNMVIERALLKVRDHISDGLSISESFARVNLFPPLVLRMVSIGETTGQLDKALFNVSYFYNREVKERVDKLQTVIEPTMTLVMGSILAWVMLSVFGPLYDLITSLPI